jgi:hypothetical protein
MRGRPALCAQRLLAGLMALAVVACAVRPEANAPAVSEFAIVPEDTKQLADLIGYYTRVTVMAPEEQRREYAGATQTFNRERSEYNRVRLALLAAMPGTSFQDDARALGLLEPFAAPGANGGKVAQFGAMLHAQVSERAKARGRAEQLKEQLDALRAVERAIIERGQMPPTKRQ